MEAVMGSARCCGPETGVAAGLLPAHARGSGPNDEPRASRQISGRRIARWLIDETSPAHYFTRFQEAQKILWKMTPQGNTRVLATGRSLRNRDSWLCVPISRRGCPFSAPLFSSRALYN